MTLIYVLQQTELTNSIKSTLEWYCFTASFENFKKEEGALWPLNFKSQIVVSLVVPHLHVFITKVVNSNPDHGQVYSIQHYVIQFVSDLRQVGGFLRVARFPHHQT